jgi:hypothetical protein
MSLKTLWKIRSRSLVDKLDLFPLTSKLGGQEPLFLFARGLIFSSALIEEICQDLPQKYNVSWGQMMTENGSLSREADVIIYEGNPFHEWRTETMRFTLVPKEQVRAEIECCQYFRPTKHHEEHLKAILKFAPIVFLFSECCWTKRENLCRKKRQRFLEMGYEDVFYLYRWHYGIDKGPNEDDWFRFLNMIREL